MNKIFYILLLLFVSLSLFGASAVAASDVTEDVIANDELAVNELNVNEVTADEVVIDDVDLDELAIDDDVDKEIVVSDSKKSASSKKLSAGTSYSFNVLNNDINDKNVVKMTFIDDYKFYSKSDSAYKDGIVIDHSLTIDGNGHTIDADHQARIFKISRNGINVVLQNIIFINGWTRDIGGAAIFGNCTVINCTFRDNDFGYYGLGGAMYGGTAINCLFENNNYDRYESADSQGGAMFGGTAINCIFRNNGAAKGGAVANCSLENCTLEGNRAGNWAGAMYGGTAKGCTFIGNYAPMSGGAIDTGYAENCTFIGNKANVGAAIADGDAVLCTFSDNIVGWGGSAIQWGNATLCNFNNETIGETTVIPGNLEIGNAKAGLNAANQLVLKIKVGNKVFDGYKAVLKVYQGDDLVDTINVLTGETLDLKLAPGVYKLVASLEDFPNVEATESTLRISNVAN